VSNLDDAKRRGKKPRAKTRKISEYEPDKSSKQGLSPSLQGHIGRQLRAMFDGVAREPVPDRFLQLLKDLEQSGDK
jgi:hypothetical protein